MTTSRRSLSITRRMLRPDDDDDDDRPNVHGAVIVNTSVGTYVANTNARGQLMLILGTMHNLEVYAVVIQKNDGAILKNQL